MSEVSEGQAQLQVGVTDSVYMSARQVSTEVMTPDKEEPGLRTTPKV